MKKIISIILALVVVICALPIVSFASTTIKLGDYVRMGTYYGQPILWRCVSFEKISGYDAKGNPIIDDSTDTRTTYADGYLPLMLADRIICIKAFDGAGTNTSGSHGRGKDYNSQRGYYRRIEGSNYWADSNIRCWLNSTATAGNVVWTCGNAPTSSNMYKGYNAYDQEAGFLSNFTADEMSAIKSVTQKSLLDCHEYRSEIDSKYHIYSYPITYAFSNYVEACSEQVTDKMFLLDVRQIITVYQYDSNLGGNKYYIGIPSAEAVANSAYKDSDLNATTKWWSWLRSPLAYNGGDSRGSGVRFVDSAGNVNGHSAYTDSLGVRPAFYLNLTSLNLKGKGTIAEPYECPYKTTAPYSSELEYGDKLCNSTLTGGSVTYNGTAIAGSFIWKNGEKILEAGEHEETAVFIPKDKSYEERECTVKVKINKKSLNIVFPTFTKTDYVIGTKLSEIEIENTNEYGTFSWKNPNQTITKGENICKMIFTPKDTKNYSYDITSKDYTFTNSVLQSAISVAEGESVQVGSNTTRNVTVSSNKKIYAVSFDVEYPLDTELTSISKKDFANIEISDRVVKSGLNVATITAQYSDSTFAEENIYYTLLALNFNISQTAKSGEKAIAIKNVTFYDDEYEEIAVSQIEGSIINVTPKLAESVSISGSSTIYDKGQYTANVLPSYTLDKSVTWSVNDESIATISQDGVLTAIKNGTVTITATANDGSGKYATKTVNVYVYAKINTLVSDIGKWDRSFNPSCFNYKLYVGTDAESVGITADFTGGSLKLNGTALMLNKVKKNIVLNDTKTVITLNRVGVTDNVDSVYTITIIKEDKPGFDVECSKTKTKYSFDVAVFDDVSFDMGKLVLVGYSNNKLMIVKTSDVTSASRSASFEFDYTQIDYFKVMLLDNLTGIKPLIKHFVINEVPFAK